MNAYLRKFTSEVVVLLGGQEMAGEFFAMHPELPEKMRAAALYHHGKGGAAWKGASIFNRFELKPLIRADRRMACRQPIPRQK